MCSVFSGRKAISEIGNGAPVSRNREPIVLGAIGEIGGQTLPSLGLDKGFVPFSAVEPPLEAKKA